MYTEQQLTAALALQHASEEIVAILLDRLNAAGADREATVEVSGTLISAAWIIQKIVQGDHAKKAFVDLLRRQADKIESSLN